MEKIINPRRKHHTDIEYVPSGYSNGSALKPGEVLSEQEKEQMIVQNYSKLIKQAREKRSLNHDELAKLLISLQEEVYELQTNGIGNIYSEILDVTVIMQNTLKKTRKIAELMVEENNITNELKNKIEMNIQKNNKTEKYLKWTNKHLRKMYKI